VCTLLVASRAWSGLPLVVAANRDEMLARPAAVPAAGQSGQRRIFAPRDLAEGGTWLGINDAGLFCALTNRFAQVRERGRRSRGQLVLDALSHSNRAAAAEWAAALPADRFNPFHLLLADRGGAEVVWHDGERLQRHSLPPGLHTLSERSLGAGPSQREQDLLADCRRLEQSPAPSDADLQRLLARHHPQSFEGLCVHLPEHEYGTRSATVLSLGEAPGDLRFWHADGPPCVTEFQDVSGPARQALGLD